MLLSGCPTDLAAGDAHKTEIDRLYDHLAEWGRRMSPRVTKSDDDIKAMYGRSMQRGFLPFLADGSELPDELTQMYGVSARQSYVED